MFIEILFLVILFLIATLTHSMFFYFVLIIAFFLCLPGIIALLSAPFVPTLKKNADKMLELADIKPGMKVYDLGAGDGRLVRRAAEKGADAVGYEISFTLALYFWLKKAILTTLPRHSRGGGNLNVGSSHVIWGSLWSKDIADADVVLCFLMPNAMDRFEKKKYGTMKKGAKLVSNIFPMPTVKPTKHEEGVYLYVKK